MELQQCVNVRPEFCSELWSHDDQEDIVEDVECKPSADDLANRGINCVVCGTTPKMKGQAYGECCKADVRAAERAVARKTKVQLASVRALKKMKGHPWTELIRTYKSDCAGTGKRWQRADFDFLSYRMVRANMVVDHEAGSTLG